MRFLCIENQKRSGNSFHFFVVQIIQGAGAFFFKSTHGAAGGTLAELFAEFRDQVAAYLNFLPHCGQM